MGREKIFWLNQNVKGPFYARPGGWFCAPYGEVLTFKIVAHSTAPIMEVAIIGNRDERIAIARPGKRRVNLQLNWRLVESAHVRLKVTDKNGREAETSVISIWGYPGMNIQDCLDGNNIFASGRTKRQGTFGFSISDRSNWWHTLFSIAINSHTPYEYLPQVLRAIEPGCSFGAELHTKEGDLVAEKSAAGRIFSSPLLTIGYGEGMGEGIKCSSLWFLPQPFSSPGRPDLRFLLVLYIERTIRVSKPLELTDNPNEPPIVLYSPGTTNIMRDCTHKFSRFGHCLGGHVEGDGIPDPARRICREKSRGFVYTETTRLL